MTKRNGKLPPSAVVPPGGVWLTAADACKLYSIKYMTLYMAYHRGHIIARKLKRVGGAPILEFDSASVTAWLADPTQHKTGPKVKKKEV